eukprot:2828179-Prymnesium_polylepis.1
MGWGGARETRHRWRCVGRRGAAQARHLALFYFLLFDPECAHSTRVRLTRYLLDVRKRGVRTAKRPFEEEALASASPPR